MALTLCYSSVFDFPLTAREVFWRLAKLKLSQARVKKLLGQLKQAGLVQSQDGFWWWAGALALPAKKLRQEREGFSQKKLSSATTLFRFLSVLPWIKAVGVTGSVAVGNAKKDDDLDLLIITTDHSLWLTRLLVVLFAQKKRRRRSFAKEEKNSWCFNMWLTTGSLTLPKEKRSLYSAYDLLQIKWLVNKDQTAALFLAKNLWVFNFLPRFSSMVWLKLRSADRKQPSFDHWESLLSPLLALVNLVVFVLQRVYMQQHLTQEVVGYRLAFFHPRNTKQLIYAKLKKKLNHVRE